MRPRTRRAGCVGYQVCVCCKGKAAGVSQNSYSRVCWVLGVRVLQGYGSRCVPEFV